MSQERLKYLFEQHLAKAITQAEKEELAALALAAENSRLVKELVDQSWEITGTDNDMPAEKSSALLNSILYGHQKEAVVYRAKLRQMNWRRIAVAASVLFIAGAASYFFFFSHRSGIIHPKPEVVVRDVKAPETNRATIRLANGQKLFLDSAGSGTLAVQNNIRIVKMADGQIAYSGSTNTVAYNTLSNPRGSKIIDMMLADGSHVWLNAGSSLTYPVAFIGNERKVSVTGEAYFEVTHDATKPFTVTKDETTIRVLGTHFNVNAYDDEPTIKVTLLEGSVKVKSENDAKTIKPGEQASISQLSNTSPQIQVQTNVDLNEVMAWKNGLFSMHRADIATIMRQLARWYDVEVTYENGVPEGTISGDVPRNLSLSEVLKVYEYSGVHFVIEGKKIIVKP